ncbi:MAG: hypothetical protein FDZ69_10560 [Deltaproteobacteria bacterium]|nr:MAG: hypothetical protein FDZ69_10560 [Deltaproteobacteria bacterium]
MKRFRRAAFWLFLALLPACGGNNAEGIYYNVDNPAEYIELKNDGRFYLKAGTLDLSGNYAVEGRTIILNPKTRVAATGRLEDGVITDKDGTRWEKR